MDHASVVPRASWDRAFCSALWVLIVTIVSTIFGFYLADLLYSTSTLQIRMQWVDPYTGCDFFTEYAMCATRMCRPILLQALILWLAPYTKFDTPLTSAVFLSRGFSLGSALYICRGVSEDITVFVLPILYTVISAIFILFSYSLRTHKDVRPLRETCVHFLIASGFSFMIQILSPLIF